MVKQAEDHILIVDDKVNNIYALEQILGQPGRNLISATNGNEALKVALNQEIDLIILDVQMPGMDGFEVAQILKSNKRTSETPIIFVTAELKEHRFVMKGFEEGAIDYLYKPLNPEVTEAKVSVLLQLHRQQRELMEKNQALENYALLINNSADLICIINADTFRFEEVNEAAFPLLGYTVPEMKNATLLDYLSEEGQIKVRELACVYQPSFSFEVLMFTKSGEHRYVSWNIAHKHSLWFANGRDITRQKKADFEIKQLNLNLERNIAQLQLTNKELESFSYSVSHDLRAPLRSINGYAQMIQDDHAQSFNDESLRMFNVIRKNATKMGALIDDLLAFSRMGRKEVKRVPIDFNKLVEPIITELKQTAPASTQITVHRLPGTQGDPVLLLQVYINLISNAIKYSAKKEKSVIELGAEARDDEFVYFVKDNGAGFDMQYAHKLFGVFQRLHGNDEFEGTGVGLAIVQRIVVKHGGKVWAEGKINEGATFYFSLPRTYNDL
ncbi:hybrid sensor histidine kinase/response regulator [Niastella koreensis]|uniref:histidine kinase n=2 Tax=Niastella koreensis TaxID=354356 RepID=G8T8A0_NIAKG|nr:response regulator [Niastella koreensis]AEV99070.1 PAS/PAC sensor hybrid histidine kinase [Niastella koreensis GR20-10]OQP43983.1 hybrid sensor histidine kinase/response regulator [Niastella koreensis]